MANAKRTCSFPHCYRPLNAKGLCSGHYRLHRSGEPLRPLATIATEADSPQERLARHTRRSETCWAWSGTVHSGGYGTVSLHGKKVYVHRLAYEIAFGPIPPDLFIDHICRNRLCVRPSHLQTATRQENNENLSLRRDNKSGARGVWWNPSERKWVANVGHNYRSITVGRFDTFEEAADAVVEARLRLHTNNLEDRGVAP